MKSFLLHPFILVFIGGGTGSLLRYLTARFFGLLSVRSLFPFATLTVNILASFLLGVVVGWALARSANEEARLLIGVGFCGGLSTFSSFSQDTLVLLQHNRWEMAFLNIALNVTLCLIASWSGMAIVQRLSL